MQILLYLAIIPVILLLKFIYNKDIDKEPRNLLKKIFITGMISVVPVVILELGLEKIFPTEGITEPMVVFINTFITIALVEEGFKFLSAFIYTRNSKEFNHRYDAIVYCVFAALGFAVVENVLYVFSGGISTAITRALISVPSHACDAVIMGLFYGLSQEQKNKSNNLLSIILLLVGILIPSIEHAAFDGLLFLSVVDEELELVELSYIVILLVMVIITYVICFIIVAVTSKHNKNFDGTIVEKNTINSNKINPNVRYCTNCGNQITGNYCSVCGNPKQ